MTDNLPTNRQAVKNLVRALMSRHDSYAYTTGYLTSTLDHIISTYVPREKQAEVRIELLAEACNIVLGGEGGR